MFACVRACVCEYVRACVCVVDGVCARARARVCACLQTCMFINWPCEKTHLFVEDVTITGELQCLTFEYDVILFAFSLS